MKMNIIKVGTIYTYRVNVGFCSKNIFIFIGLNEHRW